MIGPAGQIVIRAGGAAVGITGASTAAASASTVILAAGTAFAIGAAGYGAYRWLSAHAESQQKPPLPSFNPHAIVVPVVAKSVRNLRDRFRR